MIRFTTAEHGFLMLCGDAVDVPELKVSTVIVREVMRSYREGEVTWPNGCKS